MPREQVPRQNSARSGLARHEANKKSSRFSFRQVGRALNVAGDRYRSSVQQVFPGLDAWRIGVFTGCLSASIVLLVNTLILLLALFRHGGFHDGMATLARGETASIARMSTAYHIFINILSTILLSSSSYTMQVLSSPTRLDIERAHRRGQWLDIGVLSMRNLQHINRKHRVLWIILATSSVPLHLFYNAAVFKSTVAHEYNATFVNYKTEQWFQFNSSATDGSIANLTNYEWQGIFGEQFVSDYTELYIVFDGVGMDLTRHDTSSQVNVSFEMPWPESEWTQATPVANISRLSWFGDEWLTTNSGQYIHVRHAFARPAGNDQSAIRINLLYMLIVVVANLIKAATMGYVVLGIRSVGESSPLVTLGDAIASFLACPDPTTRHLSTASRDAMFTKQGSGAAEPKKMRGAIDEQLLESISRPVGHEWHPQQHCLGMNDVTSLRLMLCNITLIVATVSLSSALAQDNTLQGWGPASGSTIFTSRYTTAGILLNAWLTNLPQLAFSAIYFSLNGLYTKMAISQEWNAMAIQRKGLRVSQPKQAQRSTYFLQLPYRWAIPLTVASGSMHWLISQSLYLVQVDVRSATGERDTGKSFAASGFSSLSYLVLVIVFGLMLVIAYLFAMIPLRENIPVGASCSAIVSAACHPPRGDTEAHLKQVQWGVTEEVDDSGIAHCAFSSRAVSLPVPGTRYV